MDELMSDEIADWHRRLCKVTDWLFLCGDLPEERQCVRIQLAEWVDAGVTDIVDVREEWTDEKLVRQFAPHVRYHHLGTHDDGGAQDAEWFTAGLTALHDALAHDGAKVVVHCHMGVNRGPSMGFAYLLDQGWSPDVALRAIREARPIAAIAYAKDALDAHHVRREVAEDQRVREQQLVDAWMVDNDVNVATIIRKIREAE